jgi:hypothetical protein
MLCGCKEVHAKLETSMTIYLLITSRDVVVTFFGDMDLLPVWLRVESTTDFGGAIGVKIRENINIRTYSHQPSNINEWKNILKQYHI